MPQLNWAKTWPGWAWEKKIYAIKNYINRRPSKRDWFVCFKRRLAPLDMTQRKGIGHRLKIDKVCDFENVY